MARLPSATPWHFPSGRRVRLRHRAAVRLRVVNWQRLTGDERVPVAAFFPSQSPALRIRLRLSQTWNRAVDVRERARTPARSNCEPAADPCRGGLHCRCHPDLDGHGSRPHREPEQRHRAPGRRGPMAVHLPLARVIARRRDLQGAGAGPDRQRPCRRRIDKGLLVAGDRRGPGLDEPGRRRGDGRVGLQPQGASGIHPRRPSRPRRKVQPGMIMLASRSGLPVVPVGIGFSRWRAGAGTGPPFQAFQSMYLRCGRGNRVLPTSTATAWSTTADSSRTRCFRPPRTPRS